MRAPILGLLGKGLAAAREGVVLNAHPAARVLRPTYPSGQLRLDRTGNELMLHMWCAIILCDASKNVVSQVLR